MNNNYDDELAKWIEQHGNNININIGNSRIIGKIQGYHCDLPRIQFFLPCGGVFVEVSERFQRSHIIWSLQQGYMQWLTNKTHPYAGEINPNHNI